MEIYEEKQVTSTVRKLIKMNCDICGVEIKYNAHRYDEVQVSCTEGESYGNEGYDYTETNYNVCISCFKKVLEPFLQSFHCAPRITRYEE